MATVEQHMRLHFWFSFLCNIMVVYVLELKLGNYYVGRTNNLQQRLKDHANGNGSEWTKRFPMIQLIETYNEDSPFYEDMITKQMMAKHGIDHVRGGSYCQINLPQSKRDAIITELRGAAGVCFKCGGKHFVRDCHQSDSANQKNEDLDLVSRVVASANRKALRAINWLWS